jgi:hypothetical protein
MNGVLVCAMLPVTNAHKTVAPLITQLLSLLMKMLTTLALALQQLMLGALLLVTIFLKCVLMTVVLHHQVLHLLPLPMNLPVTLQAMHGVPQPATTFPPCAHLAAKQ